MRLKIAVLTFLLLISGSEAFSCTIMGISLFKPKTKSKQTPFSSAKKAIPKPIVNSVKVTRGVKSAGTSCDDAGVISLEISLPEGSSDKIEDYGFSIGLTKGVFPGAIFPNRPFVGRVKNNKSTVIFPWLDRSPSQQKDIDIEVEISLVATDFGLGPSTKFAIKAKKASDDIGWLAYMGAVTSLSAIIKDKNKEAYIRSSAISNFTRFIDNKNLPLFIGIINDKEENPDVRSSAILALSNLARYGKYGKLKKISSQVMKEAETPFITALNDESYVVRQAAIIADQ